MSESYMILSESLVKSGCHVDQTEFADKFHQFISEYYRCRAIDLIERPIEEILRKTLDYFLIDDLPEKALKKAIKAMYTYTESLWKIESDTHETLTQLKEMGFHLGLISNASNADDLNRLVDNHKLRKYFEIVVISAEEGIRKPDPRIFTNTLNKLGTQPERSAMVGDTLTADVLGAQRSGLRSIWITRRADRRENNEVLDTIHPDHTIPDLISLVSLVKQIGSPTT